MKREGSGSGSGRSGSRYHNTISMTYKPKPDQKCFGEGMKANKPKKINGVRRALVTAKNKAGHEFNILERDKDHLPDG